MHCEYLFHESLIKVRCKSSFLILSWFSGCDRLAQKTMKKGQQLYSIFTNRLDSIINICLKPNHGQKASLQYETSFTNSH